MLPYESRLNAPSPTQPQRSLNAFAANRAIDNPAPSLAAGARRLADPYSAAVGSGGFATSHPTASATAPRELTPLQRAQIGAHQAAIIHKTGGTVRRAANLALGAVGRAAVANSAEKQSTAPARPMAAFGQTDSSMTMPKMGAAQTPENFGPQKAIGKPRSVQDDIAYAKRSARALQDILGAPSLRLFRSKRQALANEFSRAMGAQDSLHAQSPQAQDNSTMEQGRQAHDVQQANANRRQQAAQFNAQQFGQAQLARRSLDTQSDQPWQMSQSADGTPGIIRTSGRFTPITGADGQPVELARPQQGIAPETLFKAFTEAENSIRNNLTATPEEQQTQLAQLYRNPLYQPLLRQNAPSPDAQLTPNGQWVRQLPDGRYQAYGE